MSNEKDNETNQGITFKAYKQVAAKVFRGEEEFEKLNYDYFKNHLTKNDALRIIVHFNCLNLKAKSLDYAKLFTKKI